MLLALCSRASPLYPYHCGGDANICFTIGQKGPLLFFLQMLGSLVSRQTFFGVWMPGIAAGTAFLHFSARTAALFAPPRLRVVRRGEFDFAVTANNHVMYEELTGHCDPALTATEPAPDGRDSFFNLYQRAK